MSRALISVSDKTGVVEFAKGLVENGVSIISTGGTKSILEKAGIQTTGIEEVTGFPEMLDGRVKTLHPKIHGGLLGRRDLASHVEAMSAHKIEPIDYVCVNLYPFKETIEKKDVTLAEAIENIDIGGPSMIRSAAKNYQAVTVVVDTSDYASVLADLRENGETSLETRERLAAKAFRHTAAYDALIAAYLTEQVAEAEPEKLTLTYDLKQSLRYGENGHQEAVFYQNAKAVPFSIAAAKQLHGKELSYNNIKDADAAMRMSLEFTEPAVVAVKHMNPCGIGIGEDIAEAYDRAYAADPISIFGGILVFNREIDAQIAEKLHGLFLEMVLAPSFTEEAFAILTKKKNIRLLTVDFTSEIKQEKEVVSVLGGLLLQDQDISSDESAWQVVTKRQPSETELTALRFAWKAVKHVKSNAIVIADDQQTLGIGAGQMNRIGAAKIAIAQAEAGDMNERAVLSSDAFFPMADTVAYAAEHGIKAIIQPGGSIKDQDSIMEADKHGIAMIVTGERHFRH